MLTEKGQVIDIRHDPWFPTGAPKAKGQTCTLAKCYELINA